MIYTAPATSKDIPEILGLQEKFLFQKLSAQARQLGFVTTPFTSHQIEQILEERGAFVARNSEGLVAYAFAASWHYFSQWEIFNHMVSRFPLLEFGGRAINTDNSFQYGPVCIDLPYRRRGVLPMIFEEMRREFVKKYPISVTFINKANPISEAAHRKLGWQIVDEFSFNNKSYIGLAFDMQRPVA